LPSLIEFKVRRYEERVEKLNAFLYGHTFDLFLLSVGQRAGAGKPFTKT
jgi:hypothetical protein